MADVLPPADWFPDPTGRHGQRYWDGTSWTEHVFTDGVQGVDPLDVEDVDDGTGDDPATGEPATAGGAAPDGDERATAHGETPVTAADTAAAGTWAPTDDGPVPDETTTAVGPTDGAASPASSSPVDDRAGWFLLASDPPAGGDAAPAGDDDTDPGEDDREASAPAPADTDLPADAPAASVDADGEAVEQAPTSPDDGEPADDDRTSPDDEATDGATASVAWGLGEFAAAPIGEAADDTEGDAADDGLDALAADLDELAAHTPADTEPADGPAIDDAVPLGGPPAGVEPATAEADGATPEDLADPGDQDVPGADGPDIGPAAAALGAVGGAAAALAARDGDDEGQPEAAADDGGAVPPDDGSAPPPDATATDGTGADDQVEDDATAAQPAWAASPPPSVPAAPAPATTVPVPGDGISGALVDGAYREQDSDEPAVLQNPRLLRCHLRNSGMLARQGTMVAYQGSMDFAYEGAGGLGRAVKRAATGEGVRMMRVTGTGDVFFADQGKHVFLLELDGHAALSVNGQSILAFSDTLQWSIERVQGASLLSGGLFNTTLRGSGWCALVTDGQPVVLRAEEAPTYADINALVAWSSNLQTKVVTSMKAGALAGFGSGEAMQMLFTGQGLVIVQPSEGAPGSMG